MARTVKPPFLSGLLDLLPKLRLQQALMMLCALGLYANTLGHQFALDDGLVLSDNTIVQKGIRGIPEILAKDSFYGAIGESAYLTGHRYRPLPLITYAIEVSFFGLTPPVHHAVNVLLYALTGLLLLRLLRRHVFPADGLAALAATVLFIFHPLHTEVVANIKSRDELLSLLFLLLTLHSLLDHVIPRDRTDDGKRKGRRRTQGEPTAPGKGPLLRACVFYALALLSKENGVVFVVLLPLTLYVVAKLSVARALRVASPFMAIAVGYVLLRFLLLGTQTREVTEVMDNPYLFASMPEKFATILFVFAKYIGLLFVPHPLTYDYSFRQISYRTFGDPVVWLGGLMLLFLVAFAIRGAFKRDLLAWCATFFLGTWVLVSGIFFNIGAPMAERFMYQASVPFIIALVECVRRWFPASATPSIARPVLFAGAAVVLAAGALATITRNRVWHTGDELLLHDVITSANSARANTYAGVACIHGSDAAREPAEKRAFAERAIAYCRRSEAIKPMYVPNYLNLGVAYMRLDDVRRAEAAWDTARALDPGSGLLKQYDAYLFDLYYRSALEAGADRDNAGAIIDLRKALKYGPANADAWYNLGGAYYTSGDTAQARNSWQRCLQLDPRNAGAQQGLAALGRPSP